MLYRFGKMHDVPCGCGFAFDHEVCGPMPDCAAEIHFDATVAGCGDVVARLFSGGVVVGEAAYTSTGHDDMGHIHITAVAHGPVSVVNSCADATVYRCSMLMRELS